MDQQKSRRFDNVDYDEAMRRAADLVPLLREHAGTIEHERQLTPVVLDALHASGLIRAFQPKSWGGMELDFAAWADIPEMLARGDCSTAWNLANLASHHRTLAQFGEAAQREVWSENPDALIASGNAYPQGHATKVDDGLMLSGTWNFCSGVLGASWNLLSCTVRDGEQPVDWVTCLLPSAEYEIIDDWQTLGMRGTGSCTVKVDNLFVPAYRTQSMAVGLPGHMFAGTHINTNPIYRISTPAIGGHGLGACVVGTAQGALDAMVDWITGRSTTYVSARMREFQTVQLRIGHAGAKIDAARLILHTDCVEAEQTVRSGQSASFQTKLRYKRNAAAAIHLAVEAVDILHEMAGANGIYDSSPLQRMFRDVKSASVHIHFSTDLQMTQWGNVVLGGKINSPTM